MTMHKNLAEGYKDNFSLIEFLHYFMIYAKWCGQKTCPPVRSQKWHTLFFEFDCDTNFNITTMFTWGYQGASMDSKSKPLNEALAGLQIYCTEWDDNPMCLSVDRKNHTSQIISMKNIYLLSAITILYGKAYNTKDFFNIK